MQQKRLFLEGIDSDTADELLPQGRDRYRLNVRVLSSENSTIGAIETNNGNTLVTFTLPSGTNKVIGAKEDILRKYIYYFVYNTLSNHSILEYNITANSIEQVFEGPELNFNSDYLITGINIVELNPTAHLLYWTDNYNEPKKINIEKGKYFMQGDYVNGYKSPFNPEILYRIKQPSECGPTYEWETINLNEQIIYAYSSTGITDPLLQTFPLDSTFVNVGAEFDTTTYQWDVGASSGGNYSIYYAMTVVDTTGAISYIYLQKNGATIAQIDVPANANGTFDQTVSVSVVAGDAINIVVTNGGVVSTTFGPTSAFIVTRIPEQLTINKLFKKLFVFKIQYVYDDYEVSSWSPWSSYQFPEVSWDPAIGNDIIDQSNKIIITVPTGNSIVTKIRIAAKEVSVENPIEVGDFVLVAELDKAELNIADDTTYDFDFFNDGNYLQLDVNESNKLFDSVPLLSQSQEIIDEGRIVDGLITEGFDPVNIDMRLPLTFVDDTDHTLLTSKSWLKSGGTYKYGIVYYDHANRSGTTQVNKGDSLTYLPDSIGPYGKFGTTVNVPFLTQIAYSAPHGAPPNNEDMKYTPQVNWEIYNSPPSWATHYQILRSKNEAIGNYFQFCAQKIEYVDSTGNLVPANLATDLYVYIDNIEDIFKLENPSSTLTYDFTVGDRIRFIANKYGGGPTYNAIDNFFPFNDNEILTYDPSNGIVHLRMNPNIPQDLSAGVLYEIYSPISNVINDQEFMYEIGECFEIGTDIHGNRVHLGPVEDQMLVNFTASSYAAPTFQAAVSSGHGLLVGDKVKIVSQDYEIYGEVTVVNPTDVTISTSGFLLNGTHQALDPGIIYKAAIGETQSGDCFRILQDMSWVVGVTPNRLYSYVECSSISNLWSSKATDYARPNRIDDMYRQITRPSTVYYSQKFIPETFINGISTVYDTNFESYSPQYGGIYKLYTEQQTLFVFQELKIGQLLILQNIYNGTQGESVVGNSSQVLSPTMRYYDGEFGIGKHPESFAVYENSKYGIDVRRGAIWRLSVDGLTPISKIYFMNNYVTDKCEDIISYDGKINIYGTYDTKFNEYIIAFDAIPDVSVAETLAFNEKFNAFSTFYSYLPEFMCTNGTGIVSFKAGRIYTHNTNALQANFYGVQYYPEIHCILNDNPSNVKVLEAVSEETNAAWEVYSITTPNGQLSNLIVADFQEKENNQYAPAWRDVNTPNLTPGTELFEGDPMRDRTFLLKFKYTGTNYNKIFAVNLYYIMSNLSNRN